MKKKDLEIKLQSLDSFSNPDPSLEQYITPAVIASDILFTAYSEGDISGMSVNDLGCGTGIFSIGASLLGASVVRGYDLSESAILVAEQNAQKVDSSAEFFISDVSDVKEHADTTVMNPPFGCQNRRADRIFLDKAMELSDAVYSIHMNTTFEFLQDYVSSSGKEICFHKRYKFNIPHMFTFHSKAKHEIDIVMIMVR